jgi:hypothetical protein
VFVRLLAQPLSAADRFAAFRDCALAVFAAGACFSSA